MDASSARRPTADDEENIFALKAASAKMPAYSVGRVVLIVPDMVMVEYFREQVRLLVVTAVARALRTSRCMCLARNLRVHDADLGSVGYGGRLHGLPGEAWHLPNAIRKWEWKTPGYSCKGNYVVDND